MFCTQCGASMTDVQRFCTECGASVGGVEAAASVHPESLAAADSPRAAPEPQAAFAGTPPVRGVDVNDPRVARKILAVAPPLLFFWFVTWRLGYLDHLSIPLLDRSPVVHVDAKGGIPQWIDFMYSLSPEQNAGFESGMEAITQLCMAKTGLDRSNNEDACIARNVDGRTVNKIISLGEKLRESDRALNDKLTLLK